MGLQDYTSTIVWLLNAAIGKSNGCDDGVRRMKTTSSGEHEARFVENTDHVLPLDTFGRLKGDMQYTAK